MKLNTLPDHSRIWIYQSNTLLEDALSSLIGDRITAFLQQWSSHGSQMHAAMEVRHNRFLIIGVDEQTAAASGCGIDKLMRFIQELEKEFNITLLDRMLVSWEADGLVQVASLHVFEGLLDSGKISEDTLVFNNLVETKKQFDTNWKIPLRQSWHARLLKA